MHGNIKNILPLFIIFIAAFLLRTIYLETIPYGFDRDEVANAYVGRFILENGKDLYGNTWPLLYFDKFGDYPPVLPMYFSGVATYIFGLTPFAARFPAAFLGSLLIFPLYFFVSHLLSKRIALLSAFILTILPWHISLSRASAEGIIALTLCITGVWLSWKGLQTSHRIFYVGAFLLCSTYLFYPAFRLVVPLLLLPFPFMVPRKSKQAAFALAGLCILLTVLFASTTWGQGRLHQTSLFTNESDRQLIQNDIVRQIYSAPNQPILSVRIFHNKYTGYAQRILDQYFSYFTPSFWFTKGGFPERYAVPHLGMAYVWMGILVFMTLLSAAIPRNRAYWYLWYLLFISPIPAVITVDDWPNIHRTVFTLIPFVILSALGCNYCYKNIQHNKTLLSRIAFSIFLIFASMETVCGLRQYFLYAGIFTAIDRTDGHVQMAEYLKRNVHQYDNVYVTGNRWLSVYYLYYQHNFDKNLIGHFEPDFQIKTVNNITFTKEKCPSHERLKYLKDQPADLKIIVIDDAGCDKLVEYNIVDSIQTRGRGNVFTVLSLKSEQKTQKK